MGLQISRGIYTESDIARIGGTNHVRKIHNGDVRYFIYDEQTRFILAVQLTLPLAELVEDFHLQVGVPCRVHQKKEPPEEATPKT